MAKNRLKLVIAIDRSGDIQRAEYGWFRIVRYHIKLSAAQRHAIAKRKQGFLARVVPTGGHYLVAVRRPRVHQPAQWQLELHASQH